MKKYIAFTFFFLAGLPTVFSQELSNALRFSPVGVNEVGYTVGMSYEKYLSQNSRVSLVFPLDVVFRQHDNYWRSDYVGSPAYFYFTPGFKFYPASTVRPVKYAIGSNLVLGTGDRYYYTNSSNYNYERANNTRIGIMVTNYANFDISRKFTMGIKLGFGLLYVDKSDYKPNDIGGTVQLSTNFGFKF